MIAKTTNDYKVYVHIAPNGKLYFGITHMPVSHRWRKDGTGYRQSVLFWRVIQKYGWDNFQHIILMENLSEQVACECEKYLIAKYRTTNSKYGYNLCAGGEGTLGIHFKHSEEAKRKISDAGKGRIISDWHKQRISEIHKGMHHTRETREHLSKTISKRYEDDITYRKRIADTVKQRWQEGAYANRKSHIVSEEHRKHLSEAGKRSRPKGSFHHTEVSKRKLSEAHKGRPAHNKRAIMCIETGECYDSIRGAEKRLAINNIGIALKDENRTAGKLHWRYL